MKFLLAVFLAMTFASINSLTETEEKKLAYIINLIWPPEELKKTVTTYTMATSTTESCKCVSRQLCKTTTSCGNDCSAIDIRNTNSSCTDYLATCCEHANILDELPASRSDVGKRMGCGERNPEGVGFRIKGYVDEAQFGEFPWMVAVLEDSRIDLKEPEFLVYQCGGSLIHPQVVLTATHCVLLEDVKYVVRAGEWDTQTKNENFPYRDRTVVKVITHPDYNSGALHNDIALLFLEKPFEKAANIDTVCLPPANVVLENTRCFASGWGKDSFGKLGKYQVILKKINLPIVERNLCQEQLRKTRLSKYILHKSFVCAGGEKGIDTCTGDGGSPLVCPIPGNRKKYYQGGIVVTGVGCGQENVPGLYANVPLFRNWIDEHMNEAGYGTSSYSY